MHHLNLQISTLASWSEVQVVGFSAKKQKHFSTNSNLKTPIKIPLEPQYQFLNPKHPLNWLKNSR